ncbi:MAG TPA: amidohydrolase family protein [Blastocatellia bacterium]|nr:amidohydrolase family protein [Blastocatellia bacterium]
MSLTVDSHQHFWDPARRVYPWMSDELGPIRRKFSPDDLRPLMYEKGVARTVLVQTISSLDETREFLKLADVTDFIAGVVGWVDLTSPTVGQALGELVALPGGHKLVGVRHQAHDEPDPQWLAGREVRRGLRAVEEFDLAYDLLVRTRELPAALETAKAMPGLRFVIDHMAKPAIRSGEVDEWASRMAPFAELPNVSCKLSGMVTEADWQRWQPRDLSPYVERVMGWFGEDRVLFGSDWPVCLLAGSYSQVYDALSSALGPLAEPAREKIFGGNAIKLYRLKE